jgi:hypothetical protein
MAKATVIEKLKMVPHFIGMAWGLVFAFGLWEIYTTPNGMRMIKNSSSQELVDFISAIVALLAVFLAFFWPLFSGIIMMCAYVAMASVEGQVFVGPVFPIVFITGLLHLVFYFFRPKAIEEEGLKPG